MYFAVGLVSAVLGYFRVAGETGVFFQAIAHVWVGGLFGAWIESKVSANATWKAMPITRESFGGNDNRPFKYPLTNVVCLWLAIGLTVLEVACAVYFRRFAGH